MFKVGQKVVCIDATSKNKIQVSKGKIYTITSIFTECKCGILLGVNNLLATDINGNLITSKTIIQCISCSCRYSSGGIAGFRASRFRPLDETFAESVLENIKEQIKEDELIFI